MNIEIMSARSGKTKNKLAIFFSCIAIVFLMGSYSVRAEDTSDINMSDSVDTKAGIYRHSEGEDCGENFAGNCVKAIFSCPSGQEFVSGGESCDGLGLRCCKKSSSSDDDSKKATGAADPGTTKKATGAADTSSSGVKPLGKIDIPTDLGLPNNTIVGVLKNLLSWLLGVVGILGLMGFLISGIQYLLAYSSEDLAEKAKKNMTYSILGITVALSGFILIQAINFALQGTPWF